MWMLMWMTIWMSKACGYQCECQCVWQYMSVNCRWTMPFWMVGCHSMYNYFYLTFLRVAAGALIFRRPRRNPGGRDMTVRAGVLIFTHTHSHADSSDPPFNIHCWPPHTVTRTALARGLEIHSDRTCLFCGYDTCTGWNTSVLKSHHCCHIL